MFRRLTLSRSTTPTPKPPEVVKQIPNEDNDSGSSQSSELVTASEVPTLLRRSKSYNYPKKLDFDTGEVEGNSTEISIDPFEASTLKRSISLQTLGRRGSINAFKKPSKSVRFKAKLIKFKTSEGIEIEQSDPDGTTGTINSKEDAKRKELTGEYLAKFFEEEPMKQPHQKHKKDQQQHQKDQQQPSNEGNKQSQPIGKENNGRIDQLNSINTNNNVIGSLRLPSTNININLESPDTPSFPSFPSIGHGSLKLEEYGHPNPFDILPIELTADSTERETDEPKSDSDSFVGSRRQAITNRRLFDIGSGVSSINEPEHKEFHIINPQTKQFDAIDGVLDSSDNGTGDECSDSVKRGPESEELSEELSEEISEELENQLTSTIGASGSRKQHIHKLLSSILSECNTTKSFKGVEEALETILSTIKTKNTTIHKRDREIVELESKLLQSDCNSKILSEIRDENEHLTNTVNTLQASNGTLESKLTNNEHQLQQLQNEHISLIDKNDELQSSSLLRSLEEQRSSAILQKITKLVIKYDGGHIKIDPSDVIGHLETVYKQREQLQIDTLDFFEEKANLCNNIGTLEGVVEDLEYRLETSKDTNNNLELVNKLEHTSHQLVLEGVDYEIHNLNVQIHDLNNTVVGDSYKISNLESENFAAKSELIGLQQENAQLFDEKRRMEIEIEERGEEIYKREKEIEENERKYEDQIWDLENKLGVLVFEKEEAEKKVQVLDEEKKTVEDKVVEIGNEKRELEQKLGGINDEKKVLQQSVFTLVDEKSSLEKEKSSLEEEKSGLEEKKKELEKEKSSLGEEKKMLEQKIEGLEEEKKKLEQTNEEVLQEKKKVDDRIIDLVDDKKKLEEEIGALSASKKELEIKILGFIEEKKKSEQEVFELFRKQNELENKNFDLVSQQTELESMNAELIIQQKSLENKNSEVIDEKNKLDQKIIELVNENRELETKLNSSTIEKEEIQTKLDQLFIQKEELNTKLISNEKETQINCLSNEKENLQANIQQLTKTNQNYKTSLSTLTQQYQTLDINSKALKSKNEHLELQISSQSEEINDLSSSNSILRKDLETKSQLNNDLKEEINSKADLITTITNQRADLHIKIDSLNEEKLELISNNNYYIAKYNESREYMKQVNEQLIESDQASDKIFNNFEVLKLSHSLLVKFYSKLLIGCEKALRPMMYKESIKYFNGILKPFLSIEVFGEKHYSLFTEINMFLVKAANDLVINYLNNESILEKELKNKQEKYNMMIKHFSGIMREKLGETEDSMSLVEV